MLIGLCGRAQAGKDTVFKGVQELYSYATRLAFADKLKVSVSILLGITLEEVEQLKVDSTKVMRFVLEHKDPAYSNVIPVGPMLPMTMRQILQRYGTESHRQVFGDNFWVDALLPKSFRHTDKLCVVTDLRYENEAKRIKDLHGHIVLINRPSAQQVQDTHISEAGLPASMIDYVLTNEGTLITLKEQIRNMLFNFNFHEAL